MQCLHPYCPRGAGLASWSDVVTDSRVRVPKGQQSGLVAALAACGTPKGGVSFPIGMTQSTFFRRLLEACPCLYSQIAVKVTARGVVHLCEVTLGTGIDSSNVYDAFKVQHPNMAPSFLYPPVVNGAGGGDIMEALCSEVLQSHGVPHMGQSSTGWPVWDTCSHVSLNTGKMRPLKLYGDILVPCAPHNLLISVKSEKARERFVVSGNRLESVGFGFFDDPSEFWTTSRMNLLKRWGFVAIYMPTSTLSAINAHLKSHHTSSHAININGEPLYRDLSQFGPDIKRIAGRVSMAI